MKLLQFFLCISIIFGNKPPALPAPEAEWKGMK